MQKTFEEIASPLNDATTLVEVKDVLIETLDALLCRGNITQQQDLDGLARLRARIEIYLSE